MHISKYKITLLILIGILLASCSQTSGISKKETPKTYTSPNRLITPNIPLTFSNGSDPLMHPQNISFDITTQDNNVLHINSEGLMCHYSNKLTFGFELAIANLNYHYTNQDVQMIIKNFSTFYDSTEKNPVSLSLPSTMQVLNPSIGFAPSSPLLPATGCDGDLSVSNTGNSAVQIQSLDMRLTASSQIDNNTYNFLDICSVLSAQIVQNGCPGQRAGGGVYPYIVHLIPGNAGQVFPAQPNSQPGAPGGGSILVNPGDGTDLSITLDSKPDNETYTLIPELTVSTGQGSQTIQLTQLITKLAFVDPNQIKCYILNGSFFVPVPNMEGSTKSWCV